MNSDFFTSFASKLEIMEVYFEQQYLADLYQKGDGGKKHRFQPQIVKKYIQIVDLMKSLNSVTGLLQ